MGADSPPHVLFEGVVFAAQDLHPDDQLLVYGTCSAFESLQRQDYPKEQILWIEAEEAVEMADPPLLAVRRKRRSSMAIGIKHLASSNLDAFVCAGNTGALIACATLGLPLLPGVERLGLLATLPTKTGSVAVVDVGANVHWQVRDLLHYARMGILYQKSFDPKREVRVGLLNIGVEEEKGTRDMRDAFREIQALEGKSAGKEGSFTFLGNVEGRQVFEGEVNVLVTNGFTGNIFLKTVEGVSSFLLDWIRQTLAQVPSEHMERPLGTLSKFLDYSQYSGALVAGAEALLVKCHGDSGAEALAQGVRGAVKLSREGFVAKLREQLPQ